MLAALSRRGSVRAAGIKSSKFLDFGFSNKVVASPKALFYGVECIILEEGASYAKSETD